MTLSTLSQVTDITPNQIKKVCDSIKKRPQIVLDLSKCVSHEKELDSVLAKRDSLIDELKARIEKLKAENKRYTDKIIELNDFIMATSKKVDSISEKQIKNERRFWQGLHGHIQTSTLFDLKEPVFSADMTYDLDRWSFGVEINHTGDYFIKLRYTIF